MSAVQSPAQPIKLLAVGGTVATVGSAAQEAGQSVFGARAMLERLGADTSAIDAADVLRTPSFALTPPDMLTVARAAAGALAAGCPGVVITHGTDTLEETAYMLALTLPRGRPVVLTGAMRLADAPGADGPANLAAALLVAASPAAAGLGPVVVLNDEIHPARFVAKQHASSPSGFASPGAGPLGEIVEGRVDVWYAPAYADHLGMPADVAGIRVPVVAVGPDDDAAVLEGVLERGVDGVVLEGTGGGHVSPRVAAAGDAAIAAGIPVVVASRVAAGATFERTYASVGGDVDLRRRGFVGAGRLSARKARLRLVVGRALGLDPASIFPVL